MLRDIRVSVVICTHSEERLPLLREAVASVQSQSPPPDEVIVVVDHNPALLDAIGDQHAPAIVLGSSGPPGLSGARNTGVGAASGEIVAFLDDDAYAEPGWLSALVTPYAKPDVLGVGGVALPEWQTAQPRWFPAEFLWVVGCSYEGLPTTIASVRNMIGCNMSMRRSVFPSVGGFHHGVGRGRGLPMGCEETEMCIRATRQLGGLFMHQPPARVRHVVPASRTRLRYFLLRCFAEGASKAYVVMLAGSARGMESERRYARRTLPRGMLRGVGDALGGDLFGLARAAMILLGSLSFSFGYVHGTARQGNLRGMPAGHGPAKE